MDGPDSASKPLEQYRPYLNLLVRLDVDPQFQGKVDLSGVVQQTLLEAHREFDELERKTTAQVLAWLRKALANNLTDEIRKLKSQTRDVRRERSLQEMMEESSCRLEALLGADQMPPDRRLELQEQLLQMAQALEQLPADQRRAVELHHLKSLALAEVATEMGKSRGAVAQLIFRGLRKLRELLEDS